MTHMKRTTGSRLTATVLACLLGVTLTACADDGDTQAHADEPTTSPTPTEISAAAGGGGSAGEADDDALSDDTSGDDAPGDSEPENEGAGDLEGAACLVGTWVNDNQNSLAQMRQFGDEIKSVTGEVTTTFGDDGSVKTVYNDWYIRGVTEGIPSTIIRNGTDTGTYTADDATVSVTESHVSSKLVIDAGDMSMTVPAEPTNFASAPYTCSATTLTITTADGSAVHDRR